MTTLGRYPFTTFPSGWFEVCSIADIPVDGVLPAKICGQDVVVYRRSSDGGVVVLDAFCPHFGAHLGHGGFVDGDGIRCPFHHWRFGTDGRCDSVPYRDGPLPSAGVRAWPIAVLSGLVFAHHEPTRADPTWSLETPPELAGDSRWTPLTTYRWDIRMHCQEMIENLADTVHFHCVHETPRIPEAVIDVDGPVYRQTMIGIAEDGTEEYRNEFTAMGLGVLWMLVPSMGIMALTTATPLDHETTRFSTHFSALQDDPSEPSRHNLERFETIAESVPRDIPIWENRRYPARTLLLPEDQNLQVGRRWAAQFYPPAARQSTP
ncbi:MAG: Rieske (2Fe-2S) protein [Planctomycetales bacterium]|nr:Rieske (2Fe-2S) protein [Planctomycetales bacterium]